MSVFKDTLTGAAAGAGIAYLAHHAQQLEEIKQLVQPSKSAPAAVPIESRISTVWDPMSKCVDLYQIFLDNILENKAFAKEFTRVCDRWYDIVKRSVAVGFCPIVMMPRTISGDVIGTPKMLFAIFRKIERQLKMLERQKQIKEQYDY